MLLDDIQTGSVGQLHHKKRSLAHKFLAFGGINMDSLTLEILVQVDLDE
jgi:hypothetical protein